MVTNGFKEFLAELDADPPELIVVQPDSSMGLPYFGNSGDTLCPNCDPLDIARDAGIQRLCRVQL